MARNADFENFAKTFAEILRKNDCRFPKLYLKHSESKCSVWNAAKYYNVFFSRDGLKMNSEKTKHQPVMQNLSKFCPKSSEILTKLIQRKLAKFKRFVNKKLSFENGFHENATPSIFACLSHGVVFEISGQYFVSYS